MIRPDPGEPFVASQSAMASFLLVYSRFCSRVKPRGRDVGRWYHLVPRDALKCLQDDSIQTSRALRRGVDIKSLGGGGGPTDQRISTREHVPRVLKGAKFGGVRFWM